MKTEEVKKIVVSLIDDITKSVVANCANEGISLRAILLTGSMAAYMRDHNTAHQPSWSGIPDINIYAFIEGSDIDQMRTNRYISRSVKKFMELNKDFNILLDVHPSTLFVGRPVEGKINIQLTTRTISLDNKQEIPDYSWFGWKSNYFLLYKNEVDPLSVLNVSLSRDARWLRNMYLGLVSYGNQLILSPLTDLSSDERMFDEGFRYFKEIAKDGVQIGVPLSKFNLDAQDSVMKNFLGKAVDFYNEYYCKEAGDIIKRFFEIEKDYWNLRKTNGIELISLALKLRVFVFSEFKKRVNEYCEINKLSLDKFSSQIYGEMMHWH